ncbi:CRISPR-associated RAMP protein, Cmr4 family [Caldivirga maquilingensis IC-167]|uniref:CRISPR-associated RAMP protein, Cmr4 family n=2 Tax=Caldivirga maquilingensis TaxID=76887 RepID=A8M9C2_CALMQ|nr:CRISPR-associated RAMP protein, Cmr4 family [Caldivirga maquilingensis IC-167]
MHPGTGSGGKIVDLEVQKDEFGIPVIWSSSLKGAIRSSLTLNRSSNDQRHKVLINAVFGPEPGTDEVSEYSSVVNFLDAKLLLMPIRSLRGVWAYATSRHLLNYYRTYVDALETLNNNLSKYQNALDQLIKLTENIDQGTAVVSKGDLVISGGKAVLNEIEFNANVNVKLNEKLNEVVNKALPNVIAERVKERGLVLVSDDDMMELIKRSIIIQTRVRLDYSKKTVTEGGLWEEEYLPQFTVFVSGVVCSKPRINEKSFKEKVGDSSDVLQKFTNMKNNAEEVCRYLRGETQDPSTIFILGGKETLGKGLAKVWWLP